MKMSLPKICTIFILSFGLFGCALRSGPVVTMGSYLQVQDGETREQILKAFGPPITIELKDDGTEIFTYIERISLEEEIIEARYYYFYIKDGVVVGKVLRVQERPQALDADQI